MQLGIKIRLLIKESGSYLFFGVLTTVVNYLIYLLGRVVLGPNNVTINTAIAWLISIIFAYLTNKVWVFNSKNLKIQSITKEFACFIAARLFTGIMDIIIMIVFVNFIGLNDFIMKAISNILIIVLNYDLSRKFVFRKSNDDSNNRV